jgi:hypothetical protein
MIFVVLLYPYTHTCKAQTEWNGLVTDRRHTRVPK